MHAYIRAALPHEHQLLTALTLRSKAHWGFGETQIEAWRAELTITPAYIAAHAVFCLCKANEIVGYYAYIRLNAEAVCLDNLFVVPEWIGKGLGAELMADFLRRVRAEGYQRITLESEPRAAGFYAAYGFRETGRKASSIPGRYLPLMELSFVKNVD